MTILVVVSCGARKVWDVNPSIGFTMARDAYVGGFFRLNREYAERFGDRWVILSAKYGFINPDFIIPENYNVTFKKRSTNPISISQLREQAVREQLNRFDKIVVLGGHVYANIVREVFKEFSVKIEAPLEGLPIGKAMAKLREALKKNKPFDC